MILLDTNQLLGRSPDAPVLRMLKKVAEQAGHDLVLPEMVAEEYMAHYRHEVVEAAVEAALVGDDDVPFELMTAIPSVALKVVGDFRGVQDLRLERIQSKAEAYQLGKDTWACARGIWHGRTSLWVLWKPELGLPTAGRNVALSFTVSVTVVMQLDGAGAITAAEVTDRGRIAAAEG